MMIKLAKNAEANKKLQPKKASGKSSINLSQRWIYIIFIALLAFQVYLNIMAYYAVVNGMKNFSLFIVGIIMIVFAGMFHIYRHGRTMSKAPPPPPPVRPPDDCKTFAPSFKRKHSIHSCYGRKATSSSPIVQKAVLRIDLQVLKHQRLAAKVKPQNQAKQEPALIPPVAPLHQTQHKGQKCLRKNNY